MIQESSENNSSPLTNSDHQTNKPTNLSEEAPPADQPLKADISSSETLATKSSEDLDGAMTVEPIEDLKEKESSLDEPMNINKDPKEEVSNTSHSSDGKEDNGDTVSIQ